MNPDPVIVTGASTVRQRRRRDARHQRVRDGVDDDVDEAIGVLRHQVAIREERHVATVGRHRRAAVVALDLGQPTIDARLGRRARHRVPDETRAGCCRRAPSGAPSETKPTKRPSAEMTGVSL